MNIIAINGFKRSGKGETGSAIADLLLGVHQLGFADKLKIFAAKSLGLTGLTAQQCIDLMDDAKETWVMDVWRHCSWSPDTPGSRGRLNPTFGTREPVRQWTVRQLLQYMGTEARTVFGEDFWVDQVLPQPATKYARNPTLEVEGRLVRRYPGVSTLVFTDERFENEAERVIALGGFNIEVVRPGVDSDGHASEKKLPPHLIKYVIVNDGTLQELRWEVEKVLETEGLMG